MKCSEGGRVKGETTTTTFKVLFLTQIVAMTVAVVVVTSYGPMSLFYVTQFFFYFKATAQEFQTSPF